LHESNIIFQHLELSRIVENTLRLFSKKAAEKGIELINNVPPDTTVYADADMTKAILRNLTDNAIKFTNPGGYIEVSIENSNAHIKLIVKDNGVGISEEGITKIFGERYYTTLGTEKESGTGLGLMIYSDFIASNNGDFDILSKQGEGSSIIITFPNLKRGSFSFTYFYQYSIRSLTQSIYFVYLKNRFKANCTKVFHTKFNLQKIVCNKDFPSCLWQHQYLYIYIGPAYYGGGLKNFSTS